MQDFAQGFADEIDVGVGHGGEEGEADGALEDALGDGELAGPIAEAPVGGVVVERDEVDGGADATFGEPPDDVVAGHGGASIVDADHEDVPGVAVGFVPGGEGEEGLVAQVGDVAHGDAGAGFGEAIEFGELAAAEGGGEVGEVVFEAELDDVVTPAPTGVVPVPGVFGHAVEGEDADAVGEGFVEGGEGSAFAGGDVFGGVEAEGGGVADGADGAAPVGGTDGVGSIFEHADAAGAGDGEDGIHIAGLSCEVDGDDGFRARGDRAFEGGRVEVGIPLADVDEHGLRAAVHHDGGGSGEGVGGDDDFIAGTDSPGAQAEVEGGGAGVDDVDVGGAAGGGEFPFEFAQVGAAGEPAAAQGFGDGGDVVLVDRGPKEGDAQLHHDESVGCVPIPTSEGAGLAAIAHRFIETNGIRMHVAEAGSGFPVVFCHGFPELWFSWRHQLVALAEAGYRAIAPDMRGYGETDAPEDPRAYTMKVLCADMAGLLDALGLARAVFVGHDWGGAVVWQMGLRYPERVAAIVGLNTPYAPPSNRRTTEALRDYHGLTDRTFYMRYFLQPGVAEAELEADLSMTFHKLFMDFTRKEDFTTFMTVGGDGSGVLTRIPDDRRSFLSEEEIGVYVEAYRRSGFRGGLNWYRAADLNAEEADAPKGTQIHLPAMMVTAADDTILKPEMAAAMPALIPGIRMEHLERCGHWTQQERPEEVNRLLLDFLGSLGLASG